MNRFREMALTIGTAGLCCLAASGCATTPPRLTRHGMVIGVKKEALAEYKRLHANTWPEVLKATRECNIRNYSIFVKEIEPDKYLLFGYFEYTGTDMKADWAKMKTYPVMHEWWKLTDPMQTPPPIREKDEWWAMAELIFHTD